MKMSKIQLSESDNTAAGANWNIVSLSNDNDIIGCNTVTYSANNTYEYPVSDWFTIKGVSGSYKLLVTAEKALKYSSNIDMSNATNIPLGGTYTADGALGTTVYFALQ